MTNTNPQAVAAGRGWHRLVSGRRSKFAVLALWLVLAAAAGPLAIKLTEVLDNDQLGALSKTAEAQVAADRAAAAFPDRDALVAVAVYVRQTGLTAADKAKVDADRAAFASYAHGGAVEPAIPSADGKALLLSFILAGDSTAQADAVAPIKDRLAAGVPEGLRAALTGSAGAQDDLFDAFGGMDIMLLLVTGAMVALLLIVTYRSPVLWLLPLIVVGVASQAASAVVYLLAKHAGLTVDFQSQNILTILVFGVGIDYALLLLARYREALRQYPDKHAAMAEALRRSFPAIAASAATVAVALLCLLAAGLPSTRGLGPVGAVGIVAAFAAMTTLLPALVVLCGRWVFWPSVPRVGQAVKRRGVWGAVAAGAGQRPRLAWIGSVIVLGALTLGMGNLSLGLPGDESFTKEVGSITGLHLVEAHYPGGTVAPAEILAASATADQVASAARSVSGVADVAAAQPSADGRWVLIRATLASPAESPQAMSTVEQLRSAVHAIPGADAVVGGETAFALDTKQLSERDNWVIMPLILAVVFLILVLLLRAIIAPLLILASVVLSYFAALGLAGFILDLMGHPHLWTAVPLQTFLFLVALGVDYSIFLMTRAREEVAIQGHRQGVLHAMATTGGVITSAGIVLAATFAALNVLPLVPSVQIGVIVSVGILIDTLIVRTLLVPALALDIGQRTWWPSRPVRVPAPAISHPSREPAAV
jgi:RND superfamily putative drug exporter